MRCFLRLIGWTVTEAEHAKDQGSGMDIQTKKRGRTEATNSAVVSGRSTEPERAKRVKLSATKIRDEFDDGSDLFVIPEARGSLGVFEFPWKNDVGALAPELDGCSLRDVFFSSLVDGCSAAIGFPGDRISPPRPSPIPLDVSWQSDGDTDDADCIWSWALRQPLSAVYCKNSGA